MRKTLKLNYNTVVFISIWKWQFSPSGLTWVGLRKGDGPTGDWFLESVCDFCFVFGIHCTSVPREGVPPFLSPQLVLTLGKVGWSRKYKWKKRNFSDVTVDMGFPCRHLSYRSSSSLLWTLNFSPVMWNDWAK